MNKNLIQSRRLFLKNLKFLFIFFISLITNEVIGGQYKDYKVNYFSINNKLRIEIEKYNKRRKFNLINNYKDEVFLDLKNERTLWIGNQIYTYAQCYKIS